MSEYPSGSVRFPGGIYASENNILNSSDVYELLQDISNQIMLAEITIEDQNGNDIKDAAIFNILKKPNGYLTQSEFMKLMTNTYLLHGEVFPFLKKKEMHILSNVHTELDENLVEHFKVNGVEIPGDMVRHIKNIGTNHLKGVGLLDLGKSTLEGVMNAEKVLTEKYTKGGILAFLLKLDAHINPQNGAQSKLINAILDQLESIDESRTVKMIPMGKGYSIDTLKSPIDDDKILNFLNVYKKDLGKFLNINIDTYMSLVKTDLEKAMMYLHNKAVKPIMKNFEDHLSLLFFGPNSKKRIKFKINILDFVPYSTKTNIAYNLVRTMVAQPDDAREMLGFDRLNTPESSKLYVSKDLIAGEDLRNATDDSLKGGDDQNGESERNEDI
jgi:HK97 family phage portal protein